MVKITLLSARGHEKLDLKVDEIKNMTTPPKGRYYLVDKESKQLLKKIPVDPNQELMMIPIIQGGAD